MLTAPTPPPDSLRLNQFLLCFFVIWVVLVFWVVLVWFVFLRIEFIGGQNEMNHFLPHYLFLLFQFDFAAAVI